MKQVLPRTKGSVLAVTLVVKMKHAVHENVHEMNGRFRGYIALRSRQPQYGPAPRFADLESVGRTGPFASVAAYSSRWLRLWLGADHATYLYFTGCEMAPGISP